ncbi:MAG: dihydroorotate dehydrogenase electron transfer subunit [Eubacteriales bacterium]
MKQGWFILRENTPLTRDMYRMVLDGDTSAVTAPGQFVNIRLDGFYLRRPISVCDCDDGRLTILYKVVGAGTAAMSKMEPGEKLDILTGLGNGYDPAQAGSRPLLIGGGAGVPPLYWLARRLLAAGCAPTVIMGFNTAAEVYYQKEFEALGAKVLLTTADGSVGIKGFVTAAIPAAGEYTYTYACGPEPMLKAVYNASATAGEYSFEERMGCGFGACMGCSCKTKYGSKRICRDGPVLTKEEIIW